MRIDYDAVADVLSITFDDDAPVVRDETHGAFRIGYTSDGIADIVVTGANARGYWLLDDGTG